MTTFWSTYISVLTIGSLIGLTWLLLATRKGESKNTTDQTMGHSFDGIEEYDNPLPKWWFWLFVGTLVFSVGYLILYRAWATGKASCRVMKTAGLAPTNGRRRWTRPMPDLARSSPSTPPCPWKKSPRTRKR